MITCLYAENFKSWKKLSLGLKPITGLFGSNSSGKSSILQLLLLLKQTKEATDRTLVLDFGSPRKYVNLGSFNDLIYQHNQDSLIWELSWNLPKPLKVSDPLQSSKSILIETDNITIHSEVIKTNDKLSTTKLSYGYKGEKDQYTCYSLEAEDKRYILDTQNTNYKFIRNPGRVWELPPPINSYNFPDQVQTYYKNTAFLSYFVHEYEKLMDNIYYLGPLREYPQREYTWAGARPVDVGKKGERVIDAILAAKAQGETRNLGYKQKHLEFDAFIAYWLKKIGLIYNFEVDEIAPNTNLYRVYVQKTPQSPKALITDVGFGVSQLLPVLVLLYYVPKRSIVLLEQPEIHLHPSVQSELADIIITAVQTREIQVIVESHSEYLLRRLQLRTAEEKIPNDQIALFFCELKGGKSSITPLELDLFGNIRNWPKDFFGNTFGEVASIQEAGLRRKLKASS